MSFGQHAAFIWACYGAVTIAIGGLIAWLLADGRRLARELAEIEARGSAGRQDRPRG